jgi:PAS domain S-box-containing protein
MKGKDPSAEATSAVPALPGLRESSGRRTWIAWLVLAIALVASAVGWVISLKLEQQAGRQALVTEAAALRAALSERLVVYENVLHGACGLFAASVSVERREWRAYLNRVAINERFPGVDAMGYMACVRRPDLEAFVRATQADEMPGFQVHPDSDSEELYLVKYIEPEDRYREIIGYNLSSDPKRRAVADACRSSGRATISPRMTLVGNGDGEDSAGFLMFVPVYRHGASTDTPAQRWSACEGFVYARFVLRHLMEEVLRDGRLPLRVQIIDRAEPERLIYDTGPAGSGGYEPGLTDEGQVTVGGRTWMVRFDSTPTFDAQRSRVMSIGVGCGGVVVSVLLFGIAWSLSHTRERAVLLAEGMTARLRSANEQLQQEIQDREAAQRSTRDSEALYHSLVESLPLNIWRKDLRGRFTFANQRFCQEVGRPLEAILGKTGLELFPSEEAVPHQQEDSEIIRTGHALEAVQEVRSEQSGSRFVQVIKTPLRDSTGRVIGLQGIVWDVTETQRIEAQLKHQRDLLDTLLNNVPDRIYFKDRQSRFLCVSRAITELFGLKEAGEAVGKTDFDFFTSEHARQAFEDEQRIIQTGEPIIGLVEKETLSCGEIRWVSTTKMPLRNEEGEIVGTFGISRDITEMKLASEALRHAKEAAEEANRSKSQFLTHMSHELRTPLNSIIGFSNILLKNREGRLGPSELSFLGRVLANGKHLLDLINEVLDLAKIEARKIEVAITSVDLVQLVKETIEQQEGLVRDHPVQLRCELPERMAPVRTDPEKLKRVLINLIGNALKFTEHGSVTVRVVADGHGRQPVRIDVMDTGVGIASDKLGRIFQAFKQADSGTARKFGGTGLGLTISEALCRLMGYHIEVASRLGQGSTFSIVLVPPQVAGAGQK